MSAEEEPNSKRARKEPEQRIVISESDQKFVDDLKALIAANADVQTIVSFARSTQVQKVLPNFTSKAVFPNKEIKELSLSDYSGQWVVLFYYPLDFTFVCPTEIIAFGDRAAEFAALNCQVIAASCDSVFSHLAWINTPRHEGGLGDMLIPIVSDFDKKIASSYGILLDEGIPLRALFLISPSGSVRHITLNDLPVGRNVDECLRLLQAYQHTDTFGEVCPANWKPGERTMKADVNESKEYFQAVHEHPQNAMEH